MKSEFLLSIDTETGVFTITSTETGETKSVSLPTAKKASTKKTTKVSATSSSTEPKLTLDENKYTLTKAAIELMGIDTDEENRIDIKYEKQGKNMIPIIGTSEAFGTKTGNKLTKSLTVACRGKAHEELAKYGSEFILMEHPTKEGLFVLKGDSTPESDDMDGDDNFAMPDDIQDEPKPAVVTDDDLNLDGLLGEDETNIADDVNSLDFTL